MWERGHLVFGRLGGAVIRAHASVVLGALLFGGFAVDPGAWAAFVVVVLAHELGHVAVVRACHFRPLVVSIHAAGGACTYAGRPTGLQRALIAWGGVLAQGVLFAAAWLVAPWTQHAGEAVGHFVAALLTQNLLLALFNLLPIGSLDGREAWRVVPELWRRVARRRVGAAPRLRAPLRLVSDPANVREAPEDGGSTAKPPGTPSRPVPDGDRELRRYAEQLLRRRKPSTDKSMLN